MFLLMDAHSGFPVHYNSDEKKINMDKPFTLVQWMPYAGIIPSSCW